MLAALGEAFGDHPELSVERIGEPPLFDMTSIGPLSSNIVHFASAMRSASPPVRPRMTKSGRTRLALFDLRLLALATSL